MVVVLDSDVVAAELGYLEVLCSDSRGWPQLSGFSKEADILVLHVPQKRDRESASIHVNNMEMGFDGGLFYRIN